MTDSQNVDYSKVRDTPECWAELRVLLAVSKHGSFSAAAPPLGQSVNSIARACNRIQDLSRERLFHVSPKGVTFTDEGRRVVESCAVMEREVHALFNFLAPVRAKGIRSSLRMSISEGISGAFVGPNISDFVSMYPDIDLEIINPATFHEEDVVDITISFDSNEKLYSYSLLGHLHLMPIASKRYLANPSTPPADTPDDHIYVQCSYYKSMLFSKWNHIRAQGKTILTCESSLSLVTSILSGAGVGLLANYTLIDARLTPLSLDADTFIPIYIGILKTRQKNPVVIAGARWLTDLLVSKHQWFRGKTQRLPNGDASLDLGANVLNTAPTSSS